MKNSENKKIKDKAEKVRRFPKFYVLDAVIILVIVSLILGIYFKYNVFEMFKGMKSDSEAQLTYSIENIKATTEYYIDIGDKVYFKADGKELGTIVASSDNSENALITKPSSQNFYDNGEIITVNYPQDTRIDATGNIKCSGTFSNDGSFLLGGSQYISPGQKYVVCTEKVTVEITILEIIQVVG